MEALAAIGAELRLRREKLSGDSRVRPLLQEVIHHIDPKLLDELDANQEEAALALIQTSFRQAIDLIENPEHAPHPRLPLCSCSVSGRPNPDLLRHEKVFVKRSLRSTNTNCF